ncbi:MAG: tetratricopeptide repeat protein [Candidatus Aminicenantes bacterium]|nr:tetratricopeptide repeat protein [Candidatus Aminicenantes bacterium]
MAQALSYKITVEPADKAEQFRITWLDIEKGTRQTFQQSLPVKPEDLTSWHEARRALEVGAKLYRFMDGDCRCLATALTEAARRNEIPVLYICTCKESADWPFECLAQGEKFLAPTDLHLVRCVSGRGAGQAAQPADRPLKLLFMACSALDVEPELDFELEEETIFKVTENLAIDMEVEDSGSLEGLRRMLELEKYDVVHLSGHANIDETGQPYFIMEDEMGFHQDVDAPQLWNEALIENPPRLVFLSGCRTGETRDADGAVSFARTLVEGFKVPAVLGWGRSVNDGEAIIAANVIYHELSRGKSVLEAVQRARCELLTQFPSLQFPAWLLLRLFCDESPAVGFVKPGQAKKPKLRRMTYTYLKRSQVKVLDEGFVGRRRQLQRSLRALKQNHDKYGVLLLGTGGLGKSCLAGKICERVKDYHMVIVHGKLNAISMETALKDAFIVSGDAKGKEILAAKLEMKDKLAELCASSFKEKNYLIVLDDFEQNLEGYEKGDPGPLLPETAQLMLVLLDYLPLGGKMTQLIITSRYGFSLSHRETDLVSDRLEPVHLTGFQPAEQRKKGRELVYIDNYPDAEVSRQLLEAGHGNPRLMELLDKVVEDAPGVEAVKLLEAVRDKTEEFIQKHVIRELLRLGGEAFEKFLRRFSIYRRPVLMEGVQALGETGGFVEWKDLLKKGVNRGLVEHDEAWLSYAVTPLLREELRGRLVELQDCHRAAFEYYKGICEGIPVRDYDPVTIEEWIYHALDCGEEGVASRQGGLLVKYLQERLAFREAVRVGEWILKEKKQALATEHDALLLNNLGSTYYGLGSHRIAIKCHARALTIDEEVFGKEHPNVAIDLNNLGLAYDDCGHPGKAIEYYEQALAINEATYGKEHPDVAIYLNNLGKAWGALGEQKKTISYCEQALAIWKKIYREPHPRVAIGLNNLGAAYDKLGDQEKAIEYFENALAIDEAIYGKEHPDVAVVLTSLGSAYDNLGDQRKAIEYYKQALGIWEKVYGKQHPHVATSLNNLGEAWRKIGKPKKAIKYYEKALAVFKKAYGEQHPYVATSLNNLGLAYYDLVDYGKSIEYYEQALAIDEAVYGQEHPDVARELINLGGAYFHMEQKDKARPYIEKAYAIWNKFYGKDHPRTKFAKEGLERCR